MYKRTKYLNELKRKRNNGLIKIITGPRRVGKSYLLNNIFFNELINTGFDKDHIIKFSFDNDNDIDLLDIYYPELETKKISKNNTYKINSKKFRLFIKEQIKDDKEYILLIDEIQLLEDFVGTLNGFLYSNNMDIYVTGSNSHLLSSDIDTMFGGRGSVIQLYPLSFSEYCENSSLSLEESFKDYLQNGGLPLVALMNNSEDKYQYLKSTAMETYLKDIIERNNIRGIGDIEDLYYFLASSIGSTISPTRLVNTFKTVKKKKITDDTISLYINYFLDSFVMDKVKIYNIKGKKYINSPFKVYFEDIGIRNAVVKNLGNDIGYILENLIYNDLKYKGYEVSIGQISYSEVNSNKKLTKVDSEIDFVATKQNEKVYIQVSLNISDEKTYQREIKNFLKIGDTFKKILIVRDGLFRRVDETGVVIIDAIEFLNSKTI